MIEKPSQKNLDDHFVGKVIFLSGAISRLFLKYSKNIFYEN